MNALNQNQSWNAEVSAAVLSALTRRQAEQVGTAASLLRSWNHRTGPTTPECRVGSAADIPAVSKAGGEGGIV